MATINQNLAGVTSGSYYASAGNNTIYTNLPFNTAGTTTTNVSFFVGANASIDILYNQSFKVDSTVGFHELFGNIEVQGVSSDYTVSSWYGKVQLTHKTSGQVISFQLTKPQNAASNSGVNVEFLDGAVAFTSNVNQAGVWSVWATTGGTGTSTWGQGGKAMQVPGTYSPGATPLDLSEAADVGFLNYSVNSSDISNWTGQATTFALTTGIDAAGTGAFASSSPQGDSDIYGTFNGASSTFTPGDNIVATGAGNTLYLTDLGTGSTGNVSLVNAKVSGVEALEVTSSEALSFNVTSGSQGWAGLTDATFYSTGGAAITTAATTDVIVQDSAVGKGLIDVDGSNSVTITALGLNGGDITVGDVTEVSGVVSIAATSTGSGSDITVNSKEAVTITSNGAFNATGTLGAITVASAGESVTVSQTASNAVNTTLTMGTVTVTGTGALEEVTVANAAKATASSSQAGVTNNSVLITDVNGGSASTLNGTITSVTVANFTALGISDNALTTLNVTGGSGNIIIDNSSSLASVTNKTLALGINGQTAGTLDDADIYTTLNVTTSGANSTLSNITFGKATALNVAGTKALTLTSTAGLSALKAVTVTGAAGVTADFTGPTVTSVNSSASTGAVKVSIDASKASFTGGSGTTSVTLAATAPTKVITLGNGVGTVDITAITATPTGAITAGSGTSDTLKMTAASAATASADSKFAGIVSGFENLTLTGATNQTIDLSVLGSYQNVSTSGANGLTLSNFVSGGTLTLTGAGTAYTLANSAWTAGSSDTVNLVLTDGSGAAVAFASTGITAANAEIVNIAVADTQATPSGSFNDTVTWLGNSVKTIDVSGNAGLALTATSTALTTVDASDITLGGFTWTSGALAGAATVKGSAAGTNTVDFSAATGGAVTYVGGTGNDTVTANNGKNNIISLGDGTNALTGSAGNFTVTAGSNGDTVTLGNGNNTVNLGDGTNSFTATSGKNTYTGGSGVDTVTVGGGVNTITMGAGADTANFTASPATVNSYSTITDAIAGDSISTADLGTETFNATKVTLADTAVFQDYANAVITQGGNASANGAFGWFQFGGNTYLVESRHDGSGVNASFENGTDFIVKLSGLVDLSTASLSGNVLTLA